MMEQGNQVGILSSPATVREILNFVSDFSEPENLPSFSGLRRAVVSSQRMEYLQAMIGFFNLARAA